ncbi:MAG: hypothetical protein J5881_02170 [Clostridia bacterium]|nr:hypothetical protein [Clostridia bacterium]
MIFAGVVSDNKKFEIVKKIIYKNKNKSEIALIHINNKSIENLKNIKFEIIVLLDLSSPLEKYVGRLEELCKDSNYLLINSDIEFQNDVLKNVQANIITFGLNHLATVTFSSVTDENLLISVQRNFPNINGDLIDVGEYAVSIKKAERNNIYEVMIGQIIMDIIAEKQ